ncbi:MAG: cardiolipin synthase [Lachnospiraceae bacterium]|nr:cardiolipin synthase [Lachnospiraceae bacterium]MBQ9563691.1 cardiolipin synthase [Lachnospiraceae bacterium]MBQ9594215.1 cardiolipin synthase [Lachnospiraceae bacterium]
MDHQGRAAIQKAIREKRRESLKKKSKKGLFHIVFSRMFIILFLVFLQIVFLFFWFYRLSQASPYIYAGILVLELIIAIYLVNSETNAEIKIAWLVPILTVPIFGTLFYLFVKAQIGARLVGQRLRAEQISTRSFLPQNNKVWAKLKNLAPQTASLAEYIYKYGNFPVYEGGDARYFSCGEELFPVLCEELEKAEKFIFLEYFIVEHGLMWDTMLAILKQKVKEGVKVCFLYDGTCSFYLLPMNYRKEIEKFGIECRVFSQVRPVFTTVQNNRDHRKVLVIDGKVAFTGGINLADEYINAAERFGYWKDTAVQIRGEAVRTFTALFLQMWNMSGGDQERANYMMYMKETPEQGIPRSGYMIPIGENPLDKEQMAERTYSHILYTAKRYVHIMSPYLMLDTDMRTALTYAAKRGVEVHLIIPHIPDKWYAMAIGRTYQRELLDAGVRISEYLPGFVHAKSFVADDEQAVVGTANLDFRSLFLNYEDMVYFYGCSVAYEIERDFQATLADCEPVTPASLRREKWTIRLAGKVLRLIAPLF